MGADSELSIVPLDDGAQKQPPVKDPRLPQHEFSLLIVAPKGSGKTNLICNLILRHYKKYFHRIIVVSPTVQNDDKWETVKGTRGVLAENKELTDALAEQPHRLPTQLQVVFPSPGYNRFTPATVKLVRKAYRFDGRIPETDFIESMHQLEPELEKQHETICRLAEKDTKKSPKLIADRLLVVLDDQAGLFKANPNQNPMINYVIKHRHYGSSVIVATQSYKAIPKAIRTNCNALITFELPNMAERKCVYEEWPEGMDEQTWNQKYAQATREPYSFLYMNTHLPRGRRVYKNFTQCIDGRPAC